MQIVITGGGGFLGQRLAKVLLKSSLQFDELVLADMITPENFDRDKRIKYVEIDLAEAGAAKTLITSRTGMVFHLAAIVSSHAEKDFDLGWKINLEITRQLLEACRHTKPGIRFVFASSIAVYGGKLPAVINDTTAITPTSSYGAQKAAAELLVNDYARKNFIDGRVVRLPTVCVRPGKPNQAASSFVSSIIREPINGEQAVCPVAPDLPLWLSSPDTAIDNLIHAAAVDSPAFGLWRSVNLPGITVTVQQMLDALVRVTDKEALARVRFIQDNAINSIVSSWPGAIDNTRGLALGFKVDTNFDDFIHQYIQQS